MNTVQLPPRRRLLPIAVGLALAGASAAALAAPQTFGPITLDANYWLANPPASAGLTDGDASLFSDANGADFFLSKNDIDGNSIFFHTYGSSGPSTYFGARASGNGSFYGDTRATYSNSYTNTSGSPMDFVFNFYVDYGEVGVNAYGGGNNGGVEATAVDALADLLLRIRINGSDVARDHTTITQSGGSYACAEDDLGSLGSYMECANPTDNTGTGGAGQSFNINVGTFQPGQSFTLDYDIIATVSGNFLCDGYGGGGYGVEPAAVGIGDCGSAIARSGDPFNGPGFPDPIQSFNGTFSATPEPGTLALAGLALGAMGAIRRRRRLGS